MDRATTGWLSHGAYADQQHFITFGIIGAESSP